MECFVQTNALFQVWKLLNEKKKKPHNFLVQKQMILHL